MFINGDALTRGSYRGIKQPEHARTVLEKVNEGRVRKIEKIDTCSLDRYCRISLPVPTVGERNPVQETCHIKI